MSDSNFYLISKVGNGSIWIGPRPLLQNFPSWVRALAKSDVTHVVSLVEKIEVETYGLQGESRALNDMGISFSHFPIVDFHTPDAASFPQLISELTTRLANGENLFLHCAGGIGRAGTTASCLLVKHGMNPDDAMELVSRQRGEKSPETGEQAEFVRTFLP